MVTAAKETPAYIYVCTPFSPCGDSDRWRQKLHTRHSPGGRCTDLAHGYHKTSNGSKYNWCGFREIPGGFGGNYLKFWWDAGGDSGREMVVNVEKEQVKGSGASLPDPKRKGVGNITFSSLFLNSLQSFIFQWFWVFLWACFENRLWSVFGGKGCQLYFTFWLVYLSFHSFFQLLYIVFVFPSHHNI